MKEDTSNKPQKPNQPKLAAGTSPQSKPSQGSARPTPVKSLGAQKSNGNGRNSRRRQPQRSLMPAVNEVPVNKTVYNGSGGAATKPVANTAKREQALRIIPLGGMGEVGKNMMAIEYGPDIVVIDLGFAFPTEFEPGVDYTIPKTDYLEQHKDKIRGHIITHAHEDHIGAIPYVLPKLPAPIYGARFTLGMIEKKLQEFQLKTQPQYRVLDPDKHEQVQLGAFKVELIRVTHSIPDACAVLIETPVGKIIHTGDWRLDPDPVDGKKMDLDRLNEVAKDGVLLLLSDSTNCEVMGRTPGEKTVEPGLTEVFKRQQGRIIVSAISSNIHRMQSIIDAAVESNRLVAFAGRSMLANVELAVKLGYLRIPAGTVKRLQEMTHMPDEQFLILCTGHQGEINSVLNRMATGDHPHVKIKPGDTVVMSSSIIPGNEVSIVNTVDGLLREGARVYQNIHRDLDGCGPLHVSGHASRDDLAEMIQIVKPKYFVPEHGEFHHLMRHAELAVQNGVAKDNIFVLDNGDVLEITATKAAKAQRVPSGIIMIDGSGIGDVEGVVLRDRLSMANEGVFVVVATVSRSTGKLVSSPDIISRGFVYMKENEELINAARAEVRKAFERRGSGPVDWAKFKLDLRDTVADLLYQKTKRNPMVLPVVNEV
ncbi:MAG TPA: ribonuclease J [Candidatus Saccharimonadales bacterium]|nr:ribonuclease J [Candidatus Saccharimonadales bacterium]